MIDRSLNYGRHLIGSFLDSSTPYRLVVDLGAGHGDDLRIARQKQPDADFCGVELHSEFATDLQKGGFRVLTVDIERDPLPFEDGSVDVVIANQILEHTKEIFWILHQVSRIVRVGGSLIIGVPNLAAFHNRILLSLGRQPSPIKTASAHVRGFTKGDLTRFLEACFSGGFVLKDFGGSNFYPFPPVLAKPLATLFPTLAWGIFLRFEKLRPYTREFLDFPAKEALETNFYLGPASAAHKRAGS